MIKYKILYNPLSRNGANTNVVENLLKKMRKKKINVSVESLLDITNPQQYIKDLEEGIKIIIVGGDGTLNKLANEIHNCPNLPEIYLYKAGTGNDFRRSIKTKGRVVRIDQYFKNLPQVNFNGEPVVFLNGVGIGFDALVCKIVDETRGKKTKLNFFTSVFKSLKRYQRVDNVEVIIDGKSQVYNKVWMVSVMNSKYFGGGMKITPDANRLDEFLHTAILYNLPKIKLILLFPLIYVGLHKYIRGVKIIKGQNIEIKSGQSLFMQIDGDVYPDLYELKVTR